MVWSEELEERLQGLTAQQRAAVPRLASAAVMGQGVAGLLRGPEKICCEFTYYRKARPGRHGPGWFHQEGFRAALELATVELEARFVQDYVDQSVKRMATQLPYTDDYAETYLRAGIQAAKRLERQAENATGGDGPAVSANRALATVGMRLYAELKSRVSEMTARKEESSDARAYAEWLRELRAEGLTEGVGDAGGAE